MWHQLSLGLTRYVFEKPHGFPSIFALPRTKQGSPGAYDRSFRWKYHQFRFLCHVSSGSRAPNPPTPEIIVSAQFLAQEQALECLCLRWEPVTHLTRGVM